MADAVWKDTADAVWKDTADAIWFDTTFAAITFAGIFKAEKLRPQYSAVKINDQYTAKTDEE